MQRGWNLSFIEEKSEDTGELKIGERNYLVYKYDHHVRRDFFRGQVGKLVQRLLK